MIQIYLRVIWRTQKLLVMKILSNTHCAKPFPKSSEWLSLRKCIFVVEKKRLLHLLQTIFLSFARLNERFAESCTQFAQCGVWTFPYSRHSTYLKRLHVEVAPLLTSTTCRSKIGSLFSRLVLKNCQWSKDKNHLDVRGAPLPNQRYPAHWTPGHSKCSKYIQSGNFTDLYSRMMFHLIIASTLIASSLAFKILLKHHFLLPQFVVQKIKN